MSFVIKIGQASFLTARTAIPLDPRLPHPRRHPKTDDADSHEDQHLPRPEFAAQSPQRDGRRDRDGDEIGHDDLLRFLCYRQPLPRIFLVALLHHHLADAIHRVPDFGEGGVERGEAEADVVGGAEVGDDVHLLDQRADDAVRVRVAETHVRAAPLRVPRRAEFESERDENRVSQVGQVIRQQNGLASYARQPGVQERIEGGVEGEHREHRLSPCEETVHAGRGRVVQPEGERVFLSPPTPERRARLLLPLFVDV